MRVGEVHRQLGVREGGREMESMFSLISEAKVKQKGRGGMIEQERNGDKRERKVYD